MTAVRMLAVLALLGCHRPRPSPAPATPLAARDAAVPQPISDAPVADAAAVACPAGTSVHEGIWKYQEGRVAAPLQWCELPDGTKQGPWRKTLANGQLVEQAEYDHGTLSGEWSRFFLAGGGLSEQGAYIAGAKHGTWHKWWGTGGLAETDVFDHGTPISATSFHPNGKTALRGAYVGGEMDGEWAWFAPDGSPTKLVTYARGKPVKAWRWKAGKRTPMPPSDLDSEP